MMNILVFKLMLTPCLIGLASLAGRRWGAIVSGWIVGLPLTSGPIILFIALSHGSSFARATVLGILAGTMSRAVVGVLYSWLALRWRWQVCLPISVLGFIGITVVFQWLNLAVGWLFLLVVSVLWISLIVMPTSAPNLQTQIKPPPWDLPARMIVTTLYVLLLTGMANVLGTHLTGLLSPFPLFAIVLAVFGHHLAGAAAAIQVFRGLLLGLFSFATFFLMFATLIERTSLGLSFLLAMLAALTMQSGALWLIRNGAIG